MGRSACASRFRCQCLTKIIDLLGIDPHSRFSKCSPASGSGGSFPLAGPRELVHGERESFIGGYLWQLSGPEIGGLGCAVGGDRCSRVPVLMTTRTCSSYQELLMLRHSSPDAGV